MTSRRLTRHATTPRSRTAVLNESAQGHALGITGTPTLAINGQLRTDLTTYDKLEAAVEEALAQATP